VFAFCISHFELGAKHHRPDRGHDREHEAERADDGQKAMLDHAAATLPARRVGRAEDVADAILMLMTNSYTTGSTLFIDGGGMIG
jgi:NAD(P)-dependent dehydrogenase (short-subunit alcohol dehydrogenase family)